MNDTTPQHISTVPVGRRYIDGEWVSGPPEPHGLCVCKVNRSVSSIGECSRCRRLVVLR